MRNIEDIRAELREAEAALEAERRAIREAVKPEYRFTIAPSTRRYEELYDDTCRVYELGAALLNEEALREVGAHVPSVGGMAYLFNMGTGRIVTALGSGTIYVSKAWGREKDDDSDVVAFEEMNAFLAENTEGGDVTDIVRRHRERREQQ